jgi:hypothetical protein
MTSVIDITISRCRRTESDIGHTVCSLHWQTRGSPLVTSLLLPPSVISSLLVVGLPVAPFPKHHVPAIVLTVLKTISTFVLDKYKPTDRVPQTYSTLKRTLVRYILQRSRLRVSCRSIYVRQYHGFGTDSGPSLQCAEPSQGTRTVKLLLAFYYDATSRRSSVNTVSDHRLDDPCSIPDRQGICMQTGSGSGRQEISSMWNYCSSFKPLMLTGFTALKYGNSKKFPEYF